MTERKLDPFVKCDDPMQRELLRKHLPRILNKIKKANPLGFLVMSKTQVAIFNLDGTVCDDRWRRSFIKIDDKSQYHQRCHFDHPVKGIKARLADLRLKGVKLVFFTDRPIGHWDQTCDWLKAHFGYEMLTDYELFMRPVADYELDAVELKKIIVRTIRCRPNTEVFAVYDQDTQVITMARNEGVFTSVIDAENGDVNYLTENVRLSGEADKAFMVKAEDFAVRATETVKGLPSVAHGRFEMISLGQALVNGYPTTVESIRAQGLETLRQQTEAHSEMADSERPLTEVEAQWLADAQATHVAERALNHHGRTAGEMRAADEAARRREEAWARRVTPEVATGVFLDDLARTAGVTPEEFRANHAQLAANHATLTAQEAACDAAQAFFKDAPQASNSVRLGDVMNDLNGVREMSAQMSELFDFFFPNGLKMRTKEDYQFTSILMTVFYALSRFVRNGMDDATDLQATVLHLAALEPLIHNHSVEAIDEEDAPG